MLRKQVIINGLKIVYCQSAVFDADKAVIFLHGWGSKASHLESVYGDIEDYVALDLPGFGGSDQPQSAWSISDYAGFLKNFLEKVGIANPILVGHSFGGSIIIKFIASGGAAKKAILISPSGIRKRGLKIFSYKIIAKVFKGLFSLPGFNIFKDTIRKKLYSAIDSVDYIEAGTMIEIYKKIIQEDLSEDMKKINIPVALIWGEKDAATPIWQGRMMSEFIKNAQLHIIADAGHYSFLDKPEEFRKIFLREI